MESVWREQKGRLFSLLVLIFFLPVQILWARVIVWKERITRLLDLHARAPSTARSTHALSRPGSLKSSVLWVKGFFVLVHLLINFHIHIYACAKLLHLSPRSAWDLQPLLPFKLKYTLWLACMGYIVGGRKKSPGSQLCHIHVLMDLSWHWPGESTGTGFFCCRFCFFVVVFFGGLVASQEMHVNIIPV